MVSLARVRFRGTERVQRLWTARLARDGLSIVGTLVIVWFLQTWVVGFDSYAYWSVDPWNPYHFDGTVSQAGAFRYSPAAAQLVAPLGLLPWGAFFWVWLGILLAALAWCGRWWTLALFAFSPVIYSVLMGNIDVLLGAAMAAGLRYPAAWSFVLLTKVSPGVGLLWFAVRREWRSLAIALGVTAAIAGVSFVLAPDLWFAWPRALATIDDAPLQQVPLAIRLPLAAAIVVWGARTDRPWTVVVAGTIAIPWLTVRSLAALVGLVPLWRVARAKEDDEVRREGAGARVGEVVRPVRGV